MNARTFLVHGLVAGLVAHLLDERDRDTRRRRGANKRVALHVDKVGVLCEPVASRGIGNERVAGREGEPLRSRFQGLAEMEPGE